MEDREIEERFDFIEFRQDLLFENNEVSRLLYEYEISRREYEQIMDLMDEFRKKIQDGDKVTRHSFENAMSVVLKRHSKIDYHFSEYITRAFMNAGRWEEVYPAIYGSNGIVFM